MAKGALFCMSYYGSQIVVEHYNMMGPVKAALESATRYLAAELGPQASRTPRAAEDLTGVRTRRAAGPRAIKAPARSLGVD